MAMERATLKSVVKPDILGRRRIDGKGTVLTVLLTVMEGVISQYSKQG